MTPPLTPAGRDRSPADEIDVARVIADLRREAVRKSAKLDFAIARARSKNRRIHRRGRRAADGSLAPPDVGVRALLRFEDAEFIRKAYVTILGRRPDPAGAAHFQSRLRNGWSDKVAVLQALRSSDEGRKRGVRVRGLRIAILCRNFFKKPDLSLSDLMRHDGPDFINNAYRQVLGRPADAGGFISQSSQLQHGWVGKIRVLANFRYSPEGRARNIRIGGLGIAIVAKNLYLAGVFLPRRAGSAVFRRGVRLVSRFRARRMGTAGISKESGAN